MYEADVQQHPEPARPVRAAVLAFALNAALLRLLNDDEVRSWCDR
ncbi:MAG: hypothetical protein SYR96_21145 [Actinomycetota bacterium]|nr:hypothetical protein [Actinomycetota bacterium]